jgi:hypothetical protein
MVCINDTHAKRAVDTLEFLPAKITMPQTLSRELATIAAHKITHALLHPSLTPAFIAIVTTQLQTLCQLSTIFDGALPPNTPQHSPQANPIHLHPVPVTLPGTPQSATPTQSPTHPFILLPPPYITRYATPRAGPRQAPYPRAGPTSAPLLVAPHIALPSAPHLVAPDSPYVAQGMAGENLFDTVEEECLQVMP